MQALKLEASAALEGIQEAGRLSAILSEVVRYSSAARKARKRRRGKEERVVVREGQDSGEGTWLPVGLKAGKKVSKEKVASGGEVVKRSQREIGHLVSRKVGAYSVESI